MNSARFSGETQARGGHWTADYLFRNPNSLVNPVSSYEKLVTVAKINLFVSSSGSRNLNYLWDRL